MGAWLSQGLLLAGVEQDPEVSAAPTGQSWMLPHGRAAKEGTSGKTEPLP